MRNSISLWLLSAAMLSACGPAGVLSGKVTVEGGTPGGIAVIIYGPQSAATVTGDDGAFTIGSLPDGKYVVRATVRGTDVEEVSVTTTITQGKAAPEPILAFRASTSKVSGRVVMADGSGPENLTVTAVGPETRGARTAPDGTFSFDNLKTGAYLISVEAKDTLEGRVGIGVNASGPVDTGEFRLTPVGRISGTVSYNAMPVANAPVQVTGTNATAVTDAMGRFNLLDVPTGNQAVLVRVGTAPFFRSATAMVMVARGANPDLPMSLTDDPPRTGTVTGVVTFHGPRNPRDITVTAQGSGVTTTPQLNGAYSLTLPVGVWDVVATAPQHAPRQLGRVTVNEGQTQSLPGAEVSWYRPIWRSTSNITAPSAVTASGTLNDTVAWSLVSFSDGAQRLALANSTTFDFRILAVGTTAGHRISKNGKYAGWYVPGTSTVFVYEIGTAALSVFAAQQPPPVVVNTNQIEFSSDESALFIRRTAIDPTPNPTITTLTRIKFATASNVEVFPPSGSATQILLTNVDRWFVRDSANDVRLVTPSVDVAQVFTQVSTFSATPTAWALTNCGASCQLMVQSPTSIAAAVRDNSINPVPGGVTNFSPGFDNRGDYPCFTSGPNAFCVRSTDGNHIALAAVPLAFKLNEAGDRVIWTLQSGANRAVREEAMPPTGSTNLGSNLAGWNIGWISPTRAYAYEAGATAPRTLHLVKTTGTTTTTTSDADVGSQTVVPAPPLLVVPQSTTSRWRAYVGDGPVRLVDVPTNLPVQSVAVRQLGTSGMITKYASVSFDTVSSWIIDENMATVRQSYIGVGGFGGRSGAVEFMDVRRVGFSQVLYVFNTGVLLEYEENSVTLSSPVGAAGVLGYIGLGEDQRTIFAAGFQP